MNRAIFYDYIREGLFKGYLQQLQVTRIDAVLDELEGSGFEHLDGRAYVLATGFHESAQYIHYRELGGKAYLTRLYDITGDRPDKARELGNLTPGDGVRYCGRGPVGITGRFNYRKQGQRIGIDLEANPEMAEQPDIGARILVMGMIDGDFRGYKLADYFKDQRCDYYSARNIVNAGEDSAALIAGYAREFYLALDAARQESETIIKPVETQLNSEPEMNELPTAVTLPVEPVIKKKWHTGWKTHLGMLATVLFGIAGMVGAVPNMDVNTGARLVQDGLAISGMRSALPQLIQLAILLYFKYSQVQKNERY